VREGVSVPLYQGSQVMHIVGGHLFLQGPGCQLFQVTESMEE
jgi:hypothetical protein